MSARQKPRAKRGQQDFYEVMPGGAFMDTYEMFPSSRANNFDQADENVENEQVDPEVRARMVRQGLILVGLLIAQILLFTLLIRSTVSLG